MPVTLKKGHIFYKNNSGTYTGLDVITDKATQQQIDLIQNAKGYIFTQADQFVENLKSSLPENFQTILENFSSTYIPENHQYTVGDYCIYEGAMYRCTAETDGAFDPADWEAVKVGTEFQNVDGQIGNLKSAMETVQEIVGVHNTPVLSNGNMYLVSGRSFTTISTSTTRVVSEPIYVESGETVGVTASGFGKYAYNLSTDGTTISSASGSTTGTSLEHTFTGPVYFRLWFANADDSAISPSDITVNYEFSDNIAKQVDEIKADLEDAETELNYAVTRKINPIDYSVRSADFNWAMKAIRLTDGYIADSNNRVMSQNFVPDFIDAAETTSSYKFMVVVYSNNGETYIGVCGDSNGNNVTKTATWLTSANFAKIKANRPSGNVYKICFAKADDTNCDLSIVSNFTYTPSSELEKEVKVNAADIDALENKITGTVENVWTLPSYETVVATWKNVLIKCEDVDGTNYLRFSNDLGATFVDIANTWGDVVHTHFFIDGSVLICFPQACIVVSNDFQTVTPSTIYDYDGSVFVPTARHFHAYNAPENHIVDGVELYAFGDYVVDSTPSRVWYTIDGGRTIKCMFKFGTSTIGGNVISIRHIHGVYYNKYNKHFYIATGDADAECYIIQADYNKTQDTWAFEILAQGAQFKFTGWWFDELYTYFCTDYTTDSAYWQYKGILRVATTQLGDYSKYQFVYKAPQSEFGEVALSKFIIDPNGHKLLFPDYKGFNCCWYADYGWNFQKITFPTATYGQKWLDGMIFGPNYDGDMYIVVYNTSGGTQDTLKYNRNVINVTKMARENGVPEFYKNTFNDSMVTR